MFFRYLSKKINWKCRKSFSFHRVVKANPVKKTFSRNNTRIFYDTSSTPATNMSYAVYTTPTFENKTFDKENVYYDRHATYRTLDTPLHNPKNSTKGAFNPTHKHDATQATSLSAIEVVIILLILAGWVLTLMIFVHKWRHIRILQPREPRFKHKPKNLESIKIVKRPTDSVIYKNYTKQMSDLLKVIEFVFVFDHFSVFLKKF